MRTKKDVIEVPEAGTPSAAPSDPWGSGGLAARLGAAVASPWTFVAAVVAIVLLLSWQFLADASRAVPALDTAWYQWRVEFLRANDPASLIALGGAQGALAGGYRVAEPVLGGLMRIIGGVGRETPTVVLSVAFRVIAAAAMAAWAYKHRRSRPLLYLTLFTIPALFMLQRFFGFLDNFFSLALVATVLLLLEPSRRSWLARSAMAMLLLLAGLSHPTTLAVFLLSLGAVAAWRLLRDRSLPSLLRSEIAPALWAGTAAVVGMIAFWVGGLWGTTASLSEAAVPPPQTRQFFIDRSLNVFEGMQPMVLVPVMLLGIGALVVDVLRRRDRFAEITVGWTLPLAGMFGFVFGAAYPYFRFFNATLAPLVATAVGFTVIVGASLRLRRRPLARLAPVIAVGLVVGILFTWYAGGLRQWNRGSGTWITPEVRETMEAADAYLAVQPEGTGAIYIVEGREDPIAYSEYKEYANAIWAGTAGERIDDSSLFFGRAPDFEDGTASTSSDEQYGRIARATADEVIPAFRDDPEAAVVFIPAVFNAEGSGNPGFAEACPGCERLTESGLVVTSLGAPISPEGVAAAHEAAAEARAFEADPPGALSGLGPGLLAILRLALLFLVPGWLLARRIPGREAVDSIVLTPMLGLGLVTTVGVVLLAIVRGPYTDTLGWLTWAIATAIAGAAFLWGRLRGPREAGESRLALLFEDAGKLFARRDFAFLMGAQWLAQAADGLVGVALAKRIAFGGQRGFDLENAASPDELLRIVLLTVVPYAILSPLLGVLIDRWDRRKLLLGAIGVRAVALFLIVLFGIDAIGDVALYGSFLLILAGTRLLLAIKGTALPATLGERDLMEGNSISQAGSALFQIGGAAVALVAASFVSTRVILIGGVAAYTLATASASAIRRLGYTERTTPLLRELRRLFADLWAGVREMGRARWAALALASFLLLRMLFSFVLLSLGLAFQQVIESSGATATAIPAAAGALGAGLGFVGAHGLKGRVAPERVVVAAMLFSGGGMIAFGGVLTLGGLSLMAFVLGLGFFLGKISADTLMQATLDDSFRGRGFGLQDLAYNLSWIVPAVVLFVAWTPAAARLLLIGSGVVYVALGALIGGWARRIGSTRPAPAGEAATRS